MTAPDLFSEWLVADGQQPTETIDGDEAVPYVPGNARVGEPTPQTAPELFTDAEVLAEVRYLMRLNKRHGSHPLRTAAYLRLLHVLEERKA